MANLYHWGVTRCGSKKRLRPIITGPSLQSYLSFDLAQLPAIPFSLSYEEILIFFIKGTILDNKVGSLIIGYWNCQIYGVMFNVHVV